MNYLDNLHYVDDKDEQIKALPKWAKYYVLIGDTIARSSAEDSNRVVAFSVPTRLFCAPLVAAGDITRRATIQSDGDSSEVQQRRWIRSLSKGTKVLIKDRGSGRVRKAIAAGDGRFQITRRGSNSSPIFLTLPKHSLKDIELDPSETSRLPVNQVIQALDDGSAFWSKVLHDIDAEQYYRSSSISCLIIGHPKSLEFELCEARFAIPEANAEAPRKSSNTSEENRPFAEGVLQDIIRAKRFDHTHAGYKSDVWPSRRITPTNLKGHDNPNLVLFDGASAFIKWKYFFGESDWVVVLDRTEHAYDQAVRELNEEYLTRVDRFDLDIDLQCPNGIDVMSFRR